MIFEFFYGTKQQASELGTSWLTEIKEELTFAFQCHGSSKVMNPSYSYIDVHSTATKTIIPWIYAVY